MMEGIFFYSVTFFSFTVQEILPEIVLGTDL